MTVVIDIDMLPHGCENFPWTKYHTLRRLPEIWRPLHEDGAPDPNTIPLPAELPDNHHMWMALRGPKALGFVTVQLISRRCGLGHVGFRNGVPGKLKLEVGRWFVNWCLGPAGLMKVIAMIPEVNLPARRYVRECGFVPEGRITNAILREGRPQSMILYGVSR